MFMGRKEQMRFEFVKEQAGKILFNSCITVPFLPNKSDGAAFYDIQHAY